MPDLQQKIQLTLDLDDFILLAAAYAFALRTIDRFNKRLPVTKTDQQTFSCLCAISTDAERVRRLAGILEKLIDPENVL